MTGCENSSVEADDMGLSRMSQRSRILSRESVGGGSPERTGYNQQMYSNIPIQQLEVEFKRTEGSSVLLSQINGKETDENVRTANGSRALPTRKKSQQNQRRSSMQLQAQAKAAAHHAPQPVNKQFFPVPHIPAIARVN